jgi:osmotically-inducible protein OsmY
MNRFSNALGVVLLAAALAAVSCAKSTPDPTAGTEQALKAANLNDVKVEWDKEAHIAHLRGTVDSSGDRSRAEDVAASVVGTAGRVLNELSVKGLNEHTADNLDGQIRSALKEMIHNDPMLKDRDVDFEVTNGVVTAKGDVRSVTEKTKLSEIMRAAPGVKDTANAVEIKAEK